jgi:hypothetical protein
MHIDNIRHHINNRDYMSNIDRDDSRVKQTGEVFTPSSLVKEILDQIPNTEFKLTSKKTYVDPSCGDGQFLGAILLRKLESLNKNDITDDEFTIALDTIYGVDVMLDNVDLCREYLLCKSTNPTHIEIVKKNIVWDNALTYNYKFSEKNKARLVNEVTERKNLSKKRKEENEARQELERIKNFNNTEEENAKAKKSKITKSKAKKVE